MNTLTLWLTNTVPETCVATVFIVTLLTTWRALNDPRQSWARRRELPSLAVRSALASAPVVLVIAVVWFAAIDRGQPAYDVVGSWCWNCAEWADGICETLQNCAQVVALGILSAITAWFTVRTLAIGFRPRAH